MSSTTASEAAKAVVRRNTEEVQRRGRFDLFEELFADDFIDHTPQPGHDAEQGGCTKALHLSSGRIPWLSRGDPLATCRRRSSDDVQNVPRHA